MASAAARIDLQQNGPKGSRRVLHLTSVHQPFDVRIFHKECRSIARAGYDVTLIAAHDRDETVDGVRLKAIARPAGRAGRMLKAPWRVYRAALQQNADLFHFHDPELIPIGLLLRCKGKIVVYDVHEDVPADVAVKHYIPGPLRRPAAWLANLVELQACRYFSAIIAATKPISRRFGFRAGDTVVVSNYPALADDRRRKTLPWSSRSASVAYAGLLSRDRCIREIVRAMSLVPEDLKATLSLAGSFSPVAYAEEMSSQPGWDRVRLLGSISRGQLDQILSDSRAGLCVYRPDPNSLEAAPNKLFEYMHAGLPVIASDFPGFRAVVNTARCGLLVDPRDPRSIARAIEYVLTHPTEAEQMGLRGRDAVTRMFNWASEEEKLLALYAQLFDARSTA